MSCMRNFLLGSNLQFKHKRMFQFQERKHIFLGKNVRSLFVANFIPSSFLFPQSGNCITAHTDSTWLQGIPLTNTKLMEQVKRVEGIQGKTAAIKHSVFLRHPGAGDEHFPNTFRKKSEKERDNFWTGRLSGSAFCFFWTELNHEKKQVFVGWLSTNNANGPATHSRYRKPWAFTTDFLRAHN